MFVCACRFMRNRGGNESLNWGERKWKSGGQWKGEGGSFPDLPRSQAERANNFKLLFKHNEVNINKWTIWQLYFSILYSPSHNKRVGAKLI